ncbi:MAG: hypothetical protein ACLRPJ_07185 [Acutalibacteraceae bacterium]|jgi:3-methyladenine DNA glycosylase Mpg
MLKLEKLNLGRDLVEDKDKDAQTLAHYLLGKIIHCADGDYLITVTEAYPADDSYSYIYRATHEDGTKKSENEIDKNGKAYKILTDENMVGEFFLYGGMLHLAGKANKVEARIELDNVLIRGAVKVEDNTLIIDDNINMNFGEGRPTTLVKTLKIDDNNLSTLRIYDSSLSFTSENCERIGLKDEKNPDAKAKYRFFIKEFNY